MTTHLTHLRRAAVVVAAFVVGAAVASGMHWSRGAGAQSAGPGRTLALAPLLNAAPADFSAVASRATRAVVSIRAEHDAPATASRRRGELRVLPPEFERFFQFPFEEPQPQGAPRAFSLPDPIPQDRTASGSGFIVTADGYVLTNNHVIDGADRLIVGLPDRRQFTARVVGRDPQTDVAVLKVAATGLPTVPLGDDDQTRVGEWVLAIGNPMQLDFTVTAGIVSAKGRANELRDLNASKYAIQDFIQTDAAINPGNSGGPLVNTRGEVIGINSAIASPTGSYAGYGFAIPITLAKTVMDELIAHGHVRRAILGAIVADVTQDDASAADLKQIAGVKVEDFSPPDDSPAKRAGMQRGDILVSADAKPVDRVSTLQRIVRTHQPGDEVSFEDIRYGMHRTLRVRLGEAPGDADATVASNDDAGTSSSDAAGTAAVKPLGITLEALTPEAARSANLKASVHGLLVKTVRRGGPAEGKLVPGDVISDVIHPEPKTATRTVAELKNILGKMKEGEYVGLLLSRQSDAQGGRSSAVVNLKLGG